VSICEVSNDIEVLSAAQPRWQPALLVDKVTAAINLITAADAGYSGSPDNRPVH